jgi:splicing factor U2AF subunit
MWQLQQLQARHMVLDQQAKSAATATSKTQREVYVGGLTPGVVSSAF